MKKYLAAWFIVCLFALPVFSQDFHFSQFYSNVLGYNPAFAGTAFAPRVTLTYRNQWPTMGNNFVTYMAAFDTYSAENKIGFGIFAMNDVQGKIVNTLNAGIMLTPQFKLSKEVYLNMGLKVAYYQRSLDWTGLVFPDMLNPYTGDVSESPEGIIDYSKNLIDFASGFLLYSNRFHISGAVDHINAGGGMLNSKAATFIPFKYVASAGYRFLLVEPRLDATEVSISPAVVYQYQQGYQQLSYGFSFTRGVLITGLWVRHNLKMDLDAAIAMLGIKYYNVKLGYSYDFTLSKIRNGMHGAHEISFVFKFEDYMREKKKKMRTISCPAF